MSPRVKLKRAQRSAPTLACTCSRLLLVAGGEVVQPDDVLVELQQGFDQVAADEAGDAGDQPGFWLGLELCFQRVERGHYSLQSWKPAACTAAGS